MELLKTIKDKELPINESSLRIRKASRAVLFDKNNLVPLLYVSKYSYYKLPGGGIEKGESKSKALIRECFEEVGSEIKINGEVGKIIEFRSKQNFKQTSYCYYGKIISKSEPDFTEEELSKGFKIVWLSLKDAILKVKNDKLENYGGSFIQQRALVFLKKVEQIIQSS